MKNLKAYSIPFVSILVVVALVTTQTGFAFPADSPPGSTLQQRIDIRKSERKVKLSAKDLARLGGRCTNIQSSIREVQNKLGPIIEDRGTVYGKIDAKLWIVIGQLKLAGKDTFALEKERAAFAEKVASINNITNQYKQTLDDIVVANCAADLDGFMSLIETARIYHDEIRKQSDEIKTFVVDSIKTTLTEFTNDLQPKAATEENK